MNKPQLEPYTDCSLIKLAIILCSTIVLIMLLIVGCEIITKKEFIKRQYISSTNAIPPRPL